VRGINPVVCERLRHVLCKARSSARQLPLRVHHRVFLAIQQHRKCHGVKLCLQWVCNDAGDLVLGPLERDGLPRSLELVPEVDEVRRAHLRLIKDVNEYRLLRRRAVVVLLALVRLPQRAHLGGDDVGNVAAVEEELADELVELLELELPAFVDVKLLDLVCDPLPRNRDVHLSQQIDHLGVLKRARAIDVRAVPLKLDVAQELVVVVVHPPLVDVCNQQSTVAHSAHQFVRDGHGVGVAWRRVSGRNLRARTQSLRCATVAAMRSSERERDTIEKDRATCARRAASDAPLGRGAQWRPAALPAGDAAPRRPRPGGASWTP